MLSKNAKALADELSKKIMEEVRKNLADSQLKKGKKKARSGCGDSPVFECKNFTCQAGKYDCGDVRFTCSSFSG
ncbi:MAG: hypothetical protein CVU51_03670 [Deltaproteobacteria bacterium HGW-Deltaproteobacteria-1]|jgi:hypothetical protein|nr:MAG: hypothetical protein CVU51_03670 [Deltaproteobacteria bacterium HGW-Deltaproteobacteria-1]